MQNREVVLYFSVQVFELAIASFKISLAALWYVGVYNGLL